MKSKVLKQCFLAVCVIASVAVLRGAAFAQVYLGSYLVGTCPNTTDGCEYTGVQITNPTASYLCAEVYEFKYNGYLQSCYDYTIPPFGGYAFEPSSNANQIGIVSAVSSSGYCPYPQSSSISPTPGLQAWTFQTEEGAAESVGLPFYNQNTSAPVASLLFTPAILKALESDCYNYKTPS